MKTTLNEIRKNHPCGLDTENKGFGKLLKHLCKTEPDDEPLEFAEILKSNGIKDAVWCLCVLNHDVTRFFKADVAESVLHIFERKHPDDDRPRKAINITRCGTIIDAAAYADAAYADAYADADADAAADARSQKWEEIETIFIKHFCEKAL